MKSVHHTCRSRGLFIPRIFSKSCLIRYCVLWSPVRRYLLVFHTNQCLINVELPYLWYIVVLFPQKRFFWALLKVSGSLTKSTFNQLLFNHLVNNIKSKRGNQRDGFWRHVWIFLRILTDQKLCNFNFLWGLAPDHLDGFSIGRYEKKLESFDLFPAKFESGAMRFSGGKSLRRWNHSKNGFNPCPSIIRNSKWRTQNRSKNRF